MGALEKQWRLLSLPHAMTLVDLLMGPHSKVSLCVEDCSDYFYRLLLPRVRHHDTICGYPLPGWHVRAEDVEADGLAYDEGNLYSLALQVLPMGDKKAMEIAQQ
eukprot:3252307-Amphidinium_carterae.2